MMRFDGNIRVEIAHQFPINQIPIKATFGEMKHICPEIVAFTYSAC